MRLNVFKVVILDARGGDVAKSRVTDLQTYLFMKNARTCISR